MTNSLSLCNNCLKVDAESVPIGHDKGGQRDPYRDIVWLCPECSAALHAGDFATLHERYESERTVRAAPRPPEPPPQVGGSA